MLIDVQAALKRFIEGGEFNHSFGESEIARDNAVVACVSNRSHPIESRVTVLTGWLRSYSVLRTFEAAKCKQIARTILDYADGTNARRITNNFQIVEQFQRPETAIRKNSELTSRSGQPRSIVSLTSKALWCCYPDDVPILDSCAERSLRVLARLLQIEIQPSEPRYEQFVDAWFQAYRRVEGSIVLRASYPYKVRYFDRFLWWLGQDSFPSQTETQRETENGKGTASAVPPSPIRTMERL